MTEYQIESGMNADSLGYAVVAVDHGGEVVWISPRSTEHQAVREMGQYQSTLFPGRTYTAVRLVPVTKGKPHA